MSEEIQEADRLRKDVVAYGKDCADEEKYFAHVVHVLEKHRLVLLKGRVPTLVLGGKRIQKRVREHFVRLLSDFKEYPGVSIREMHLDLHLSNCKKSRVLAGLEAENYAKVASLLSARIKKLRGLTPFVSLKPVEIVRLREFVFRLALQHDSVAKQFGLKFKEIAGVHTKVAGEFRRIAHLITIR